MSCSKVRAELTLPVYCIDEVSQYMSWGNV